VRSYVDFDDAGRKWVGELVRLVVFRYRSHGLRAVLVQAEGLRRGEGQASRRRLARRYERPDGE
jgi:hypothetical protein